MVGLLDFKSHSKHGPFTNRPHFDHSKSEWAQISDTHWISKHSWNLKSRCIQILNVGKDVGCGRFQFLNAIQKRTFVVPTTQKTEHFIRFLRLLMTPYWILAFYHSKTDLLKSGFRMIHPEIQTITCLVFSVVFWCMTSLTIQKQDIISDFQTLWVWYLFSYAIVL